MPSCYPGGRGAAITAPTTPEAPKVFSTLGTMGGCSTTEPYSLLRGGSIERAAPNTVHRAVCAPLIHSNAFTTPVPQRSVITWRRAGNASRAARRWRTPTTLRRPFVRAPAPPPHAVPHAVRRRRTRHAHRRSRARTLRGVCSQPPASCSAEMPPPCRRSKRGQTTAPWSCPVVRRV
jgi:hypothetical protein